MSMLQEAGSNVPTMLQMQGAAARHCTLWSDHGAVGDRSQRLKRTDASTINTSSHYRPSTLRQRFFLSIRSTIWLTQKPARARCLEVRRKTTKVKASTMSAIIVPSILSPWSAYRLNPGWGGTAGGGPAMLDGPDIVCLDEAAEIRWSI